LACTLIPLAETSAPGNRSLVVALKITPIKLPLNSADTVGVGVFVATGSGLSVAVAVGLGVDVLVAIVGVLEGV